MATDEPDEPGRNEPISPVAPRSASDIGDKLAKVAVPLSLGLYITGFIAAIPHYVRAGVPFGAISPHVFVAAGTLCTFVTVIAFLSGMFVGNAWRSKPSRLDRAGSFVSLCVTGVFVLNAAGALTWGPLAFFVCVALVFGFSPKLFSQYRLDAKDHASPDVLWGRGLLVIRAISVVSVFGWLMYPVVPVQFGGGRALPIVRLDLPASNAAGGQLETLTCRALGTPAPDGRICRTFYRVYEDATYVYLAIDQQRGRCSETRPQRLAWSLKSWGRHEYCWSRIQSASLAGVELYDGSQG